MTEKVTWLKSPENIGLNNDCRSLIHYVKLNHGNVFRRVVLSGMMESTKKLVKTQYKVEGNQIVRYDKEFRKVANYLEEYFTLSVFRIPAGSYPNIESRDSPLGGSCNYVDETDPKLAYKKSVFKKKSTSSTATVRKQKYVFALENKVFILLCQRKRAIFSIVTPITHNTHSFYYLRVWLKEPKVP